MAPQRHPWSFMTQSSSKTVSTWASYLFCILSSVQLFLSALFLFSEGSTTLQWPLLVCFSTRLWVYNLLLCFLLSANLIAFLPVCYCCMSVMPCWWLRLNQSNSRQWQVEHNLTSFSCCVPISCMYVWTNGLVSMRWHSYIYVRLGERSCDAHSGWPVAPALLESH